MVILSASVERFSVSRMRDFFLLKKQLQSCGAILWRVCYQRGLPRLVLVFMVFYRDHSILILIDYDHGILISHGIFAVLVFFLGQGVLRGDGTSKVNNIFIGHRIF